MTVQNYAQTTGIEIVIVFVKFGNGRVNGLLHGMPLLLFHVKFFWLKVRFLLVF